MRPLLFALLLSLFAFGCDSADPMGDPDAGPIPVEEDDGPAGELMTVTIPNIGTNGLEGHTPRGFQGQGTGLFVGDNLNPGFPDGDGVQMFLSFDLLDLPAGEVVSATLSSDNGSVSGTPYQDLGALNLEEIRYNTFSSALWDAPVTEGGHSCVFATSADGPFGCDMTPIVESSRADDYDLAQVRLRFDEAGDGDGTQDLALFFLSDSNTNEPGIFELEVTLLVP